MAKVGVNKHIIFSYNMSQYGASITEILLAMAIVAMAAPFLYSQVTTTNRTMTDIAIANKVIALRAPVLNFVRLNQDSWPDVAQIKLSDDELHEISEFSNAAFIDKYSVRSATKTDVYLSFDLGFDTVRVNRIARHIGSNAAVVGDDGVAYGDTWAVSAPDFNAGNLIYRITRDVSGQDKSVYLHRGASIDDELNIMQRDLNMGGYDIYDIGTIIAKSIRARNATATYVTADTVNANTVYFSSGASLSGGEANLGVVRVSGDINGFRNISATSLNGKTYTMNGRIVTDRATINNSVNVSHDFVLKSSSSRTISAFRGISTNSVWTPYLSAREIMFYENVGLTVSGELLMSTTAPLTIGNWAFPNTTPPQFSKISFSRAAIPSVPDSREFGALLRSDWRDVMPAKTIVTTGGVNE